MRNQTQSPSFHSLSVRGIDFVPALFCAPMAEITHCAFRRVIGSLGGCGGFFTEMLSGKALLYEDLRSHPGTRRSGRERRLIYQLMLTPQDPIEQIVDRLSLVEPDGLDLNLGCHAPAIRRHTAGAYLYLDEVALRNVLDRLRRAWPGLLSVKLRLGPSRNYWRSLFRDRVRLLEDVGVDLLIVHFRFFEDKYKRPARHRLIPWVTSLTSLPVIVNGDIWGPETVNSYPEYFGSAAGIMIGRGAAIRPWVFSAWDRPLQVDPRKIWHSVVSAIKEDYPLERALARIKVFTWYFARNFRFGHTLATSVQKASDLPTVEQAVETFFAADATLLGSAAVR